jgi:hypothetical protein
MIKAAGKAAYHATRTKSALSREAKKSKSKSKSEAMAKKNYSLPHL